MKEILINNIYYIIAIFFFFWLIILTFLVIKLLKSWKWIFSGEKNKNLDKVLEEHLKEIKGINKSIDEILEKIKKLKIITDKTIQKVGIVRFNPFNDMGGDQSFSIALLDVKDNGVVITSLASRTGVRIYAKPIISRQSKYQLIDEELQAIKKAQSFAAKIENF